MCAAMRLSQSAKNSHRVVRDAIEESDPLSFHSSSGLSTESFLELLSFYLANTYVSFNDRVFIQREGVCIGSSIAPILSTLFTLFL